jgi:hypothetical protein
VFKTFGVPNSFVVGYEGFFDDFGIRLFLRFLVGFRCISGLL